MVVMQLVGFERNLTLNCTACWLPRKRYIPPMIDFSLCGPGMFWTCFVIHTSFSGTNEINLGVKHVLLYLCFNSKSFSQPWYITPPYA